MGLRRGLIFTMLIGCSSQPPGAGGHKSVATRVNDEISCVTGETPDPGDSMDLGDAMFTASPDHWTASNGDIDLVLPKPVLAWMAARLWEPSHDAWHNIRRCRDGGIAFVVPGTSPNAGAICMHANLIPAHLECDDAEDGYEFLVTHRHMMTALRQAFPKHAALFDGFPSFPYAAQDVPEEWRSRWGTGWSQQVLDAANILENIEQNRAMFPTEGDLGKFIQCGTATGDSLAAIGSIHAQLHAKWVVSESPYSLGKQAVNIDNYMFWKLHGWIDKIWERYRIANGQPPNEQKLKDALVEQCEEMHALGHAVSALSYDASTPLPVEHGLFVDTVRPVLERVCSGCHSETSPSADMPLGGHITSADVVIGLVNVQSEGGGRYKRVVPMHPEESWLYLKAAGLAESAGCTGSSCNTQTMPPLGRVTLDTADLDAIRQWILMGAPAPTQ